MSDNIRIIQADINESQFGCVLFPRRRRGNNTKEQPFCIISNTHQNWEINDARQLHEIEVLSFPPEKAASLEVFEYRLREFPQWFFKAESDGRAVGLINGSCSHKLYITDDLYEQDEGYDESGKDLLIYGLAVYPEYRHTGLWNHISLTCKEALIGFYESFGYTERGISDYSDPTI